MKKIIDNYKVVDKSAYKYIAKHCDKWLEKGVDDSSQVIEKIIKAGGSFIESEPCPGLFIFGNMYNPELGINGALWVTGTIAEVQSQPNGVFEVTTGSGSKYFLFNFEPAKNPDPVVNNDDAVVLPATDATMVVDPDEVFKDPLKYYELLVETS